MVKFWTQGKVGADIKNFPAPSMDPAKRRIIDDFHQTYYGAETDDSETRTYRVSWLGYEMFKCPLDLWIYQEIITKQRPGVIVETGTHRGGSALYLATLCDLLGHGRVITIDIDTSWNSRLPQHPRITYLTGSSVDPAMVAHIHGLAADTPVLVILDSDHRCDHVLAELRAYRSLIAPGGYMIVEDTNVNGHPAYPGFGPGPWEAVAAFLHEDGDFYSDRSCERFLMTMNPMGFLRRR
jgi:cephalosporin hydroxylase